MNRWTQSLLTIVCCFFAVCKSNAVSVSGVSFVDHFEFRNNILFLNGAAQRKSSQEGAASFAAALYLPQLQNSHKGVVQSPGIKVLEISMLEDSSTSEFIAQWSKRLGKYKKKRIARRSKKRLSLLNQNLKKGDRILIVVDRRKTSIYVNGERSTSIRWKEVGLSLFYPFLSGEDFGEEFAKNLLGANRKK